MRDSCRSSDRPTALWLLAGVVASNAACSQGFPDELAGDGVTNGGAPGTTGAAATGADDGGTAPGGSDAASTTGGGSSGGPSSDPDDGASTGDDGEPWEPAVPVATVAELLTPPDVDDDFTVPGIWPENYGRWPDIIVRPAGDGVLVLAQDMSAEEGRAVLMQLRPLDGDYVVTAFTEPPMLDRIMGMDHDGDGQAFVASAIYEYPDVTLEYPAPYEYREGIVSVVSTDLEGNVAYDIDLDIARSEVAEFPDPLINPMRASGARLRYGGGQLALVHGNNTVPDANDVRHQEAMGTRLDASTGAVTRVNTVGVSHSFEHRILWDGDDFIEMHLGDAFQRAVLLGRAGDESTFSYACLFHIKGPGGDNVTRTQLGDIAPIDNDPTYGYLATFVSEPTANLVPPDPGLANIGAAREVGLVRITRDLPQWEILELPHIDPALPHTLDLPGSAGYSNRLRWLTNYRDDGGNGHAARPKLVPIGGDQFIVLWERWQYNNPGITFDATYAMLVDDHGVALQPATRVAETHLPRGDDAFLLEGGAAWMTGDKHDKKLELHLVDASLDYRLIEIE